MQQTTRASLPFDWFLFVALGLSLLTGVAIFVLIFVATFLGAGAILVGGSTGDRVDLGPLSLPIPPEVPHDEGDRVRVLIRPEQIALRDQQPEPTAPTLGRGRVVGETFNGARRRVRVRLPVLRGVRQVVPPLPFGEEAILLDTEGYVAEGAGENIFVVKNGVLQTPPLSSAVLSGITRDSVLTIARDLGVPVKEEKFTRDAMYLADELFMTGTAAEVTPVREVDNRRIGRGEPGPVTKRVQETFFRAVRGEEPRYREWLFPL